MFVKTISVGEPQLITKQNGQTFNTGIRKQPVQSIFLNNHGFDRDGVADLKNHGGEDRAVCFYPFEHYSWWEKTLNRELAVPAFGENVTVTNMDESAVYIGDIYQIGETVVQITQGRTPCITVDHSNKQQDMLSEMIKTGRIGYFGKVLKEGVINCGEKVELLARPKLTMNVLELHQLFFHDRNNKEELSKVILIPELAIAMKEKYQKLLLKNK